MKNLIALSVVSLLTACAAPMVKTPLMSLDPAVAQKYMTAQNPKQTHYEKCIHMALFIPLSLPPTPEQIKEGLLKDAPAGSNAYVNSDASVTNLFTFFYNRTCAKMSAYPIKL